MTPNHSWTARRKAIAVAALLAVTSVVSTASAAFDPKSVTLSNQNRSDASNNPGTNVQYNFSLDGTAGTVKRIEFQYQNAQGTDACPTGHVTSSAAFGTTTGFGGLTWTVDNAGSATCLVKFTNATGNSGAGAFTFRVDGITNATALGTDFVKVTTYDATSGGTLIDTDTVAYVIADSTVQVTASVNETLSFSLAQTSVNLNTLSTGGVSTGTGDMTIATNADSGYGINASGTTLTKGSDNIDFVTDGTPAAPGVESYGIRVSSCAAGASCSSTQDIGTGLTAGITDLMSRTGPDAGDTHTVTYRASIDAATAAGSYTSNISYVAVGKF